MKLITSRTSKIEFVERNNQRDYVNIIYSKDTSYSEFVGRRGNKQVVGLWKNVSPGVVAHELMHVIGFHHEQCRKDRDKYITISKESLNDYQYTYKGGKLLGAFDPYSIMLYKENIKCKLPDGVKIGQRDRLSDKDVQGIEYLYADDGMCTYDAFGDEYYEQVWYECLECWGKESSYGCCKWCKKNCHKGHWTKEHKSGNFVCDCGRYRHKKDRCTGVSTKEKYVKQPLYTCLDCFKQKEFEKEKPGFRLVSCFTCNRVCHAGHKTIELHVAEAYCDCGGDYCKRFCKCK